MSVVPEQQSGDALASLQQAIAQRQQLRNSWLGETANAAFFGPEEAYDNYTLARMSIEQDASLNTTQRQQRIEALKANLPPEVSAMIEQTMAPTNAASKVADMRQQGASEADIQAYRESQFGAAAAARLKALDQQRQAWQSRYDDYRQQRQAIAVAGLAAADQTSQIEALRERLFSAGEQKKVAALDDIAAGSAGADASKEKK